MIIKFLGIGIFLYSTLVSTMWGETNIEKLQRLAENVSDITWFNSKTDSYLLTQDQADFYSAFNELELKLDEPFDLTECPLPAKKDYKILLMIERDGKNQNLDHYLKLDNYQMLMNKINTNKKYNAISSFEKLLLDYQKPILHMPSHVAAETLKNYLAQNYNLLASAKILQENLVIKKIYEDPSSWKNILLELKASKNFSFNDYNHLVARIGQDLISKLDKDAPFDLKSEVSVTDLISSTKKSNLHGGYLDIAKAQLAMLEVLGISSYVISQQSLFGEHATLLSINPHDSLDITQFYYDKVEKAPTSGKTKSLKILSTNGKPALALPPEIQEKLEQLKTRPDRTFGTPEYHLSKVEMNVGDIKLGDLFKGTTSDNTEIIGITTPKKLEKKLKLEGSDATLAVGLKAKVLGATPKVTEPNDPLIFIDPNLSLDHTAKTTTKVQNLLDAKMLSKEYKLTPRLNVQLGVSGTIEGGLSVGEDKKYTKDTEKLSSWNFDGKSNVSPGINLIWEDPNLKRTLNLKIKNDFDPASSKSIGDILNATTEIGGKQSIPVGTLGKVIVGAVVTLNDANPESLKGSAAYRPSSMSEFFLERLTSLDEDKPSNTLSAGVRREVIVAGKPILLTFSYAERNEEKEEKRISVHLSWKRK